MEPETASAKTICLTEGWTRVRTGQRRDNDVREDGARSGVKSALSPRVGLLAIKISCVLLFWNRSGRITLIGISYARARQ
jgi:hypothetical protein